MDNKVNCSRSDIAANSKLNHYSSKNPSTEDGTNKNFPSNRERERSGISTTKSILKSRSKSPWNPVFKEDQLSSSQADLLGRGRKRQGKESESSSDTICLADLTADGMLENNRKSDGSNKSVSPVRVHLVLEDMDLGENRKGLEKGLNKERKVLV